MDLDKSSDMNDGKIKKILITNIVSLNPGDAAILFGMKCLVLDKYGEDAELVIFDRNAEAARKYYDWCQFRQSLFVNIKDNWLRSFLDKVGYTHVLDKFNFYRKSLALSLISKGAAFLARLIVGKETSESLKFYAEADVIMCSGGTFLTENYSIQSCLYDFRLSTKTSAKLGFFPQTLGPFKNTKNIEQLNSALNNFDSLMLRDEASKNHLVEIGVDDNIIHLVADSAFALPKYIDTPEAEPDNRIGGKVAISVRSLQFFDDENEDVYIDSIARVAEFLVNVKGKHVVFVSTCQGIDEYWSADDKMADKVVGRLSENVKSRVSVDRNFRTPKHFLKYIATFEFLIATRMHAAILGLCANTPSIAIAYEFKIRELYRNLLLEEFCTPVDASMYDRLESAVQLLEQPELLSKFSAATERMHSSALDALIHLPSIDS